MEAGEDAGAANTQAGERLVERLHGVLRPFLLRRMKMEVEKQLPRKYDHVIYCNLSKRQRTLYEEYMASGQTRDTLAGGSFIGMMNVLMQLRKVGLPRCPLTCRVEQAFSAACASPVPANGPSAASQQYLAAVETVDMGMDSVFLARCIERPVQQ